MDDEQGRITDAICRLRDRVLVAESSAFYQELLRFLDLAAYRREHGIPPARWWWYLDVISHLPPLKDETPDIRHPTPPVCQSETKDCDQDPVPPKVLPDLPTAATFIADKVDWAPLGAPRS
jgi:hypothetical protein